jgi:predicted RND superfamily exporter protein
VEHYENTSEGLTMDPILGRRWPETQEDFRKLKRKVAVNPRGLGRYVSYDGTATMISAALLDEREEARRSYEQLSDDEKAARTYEEHRNRVREALRESLIRGVDEIRSRQRDPHHNLHFMGPQLIEAQMTRMGRRQLPVAAAVMFVILLAALVVRFRTIRAILVSLVAMVLPLLWSMGMLAVSGIPFNPMPLAFPLLLSLFSLAYGVLVVEHYDHACRTIGDKDLAIRSACGSKPVVGSVFTAGLVTVCLYAAKVPAAKELACLGLFWLLGTSLVVIVLLPVLLSLLPSPGSRAPSRDLCSSIAAVLWRVSSGKGRSVVLGLLVALLVAGGIVANKGLEVGDNVPGSSYIRPDHSYNQCFRLMADKFMGPYQLLVYAKAKEEGGLLDPEAVNAIGDFSRYLKHHCGARDVVAFDMMVTSARNMLMDGNPKWLVVPDSPEQVKGMGELVVEQGGVESFIDKTFTQATVSPFFPEWETKRIDEYASMMQAYIDRHPSEQVDFLLGGGLLGMTKTVNDGTRDAYGKTLGAAFVLLFLCGIPVTGSLLRSLVIVLPIAGAQGVVWMVMAATGMKINMPITLVSAAAVGFCSIFGYCLIREVQRIPHGSDLSQTDDRTGIQRAGGVVLFLGVLLFAATVPWFFVGLRFPAQMALSSGVTILLAAVLSALLVPALAGLFQAAFPTDVPQKERP